MTKIFLLAVLLIVGIIGCARDAAVAADVRSWRLHDGSRIGDAFAGMPADTNIVLLYDPADCFTCDNRLAEWFTAGRRPGIAVHLVLTRAPTPDERQQLRVFRLDRSRHLASAPRSVTSPEVHQFIGREPSGERSPRFHPP